MSNENKPVTSVEIANMRNNLNLIRSQVTARRVDELFLTKQLDKMNNLLERVEQQQQQQSQINRLEALYNVSRVLGSSLDLQTVLDQVMDAIIQLTGAERGFLMLRDDDGGVTVKAGRNFDQQNLSDSDFRYSSTITHQVLDTGIPVLTTNAAEDPRFATQASIIGQSLRSIMATPLRARGNVIGVVYVDNRAIAGLFKDEDLDALDAFSGQAAIALDNAILFESTDHELAQRVEELRQLRRIDLLLNETLDIEKAIAYTLEWACRLAHAEGGHLALVEPDSHNIRQIYHYGEAQQLDPDQLIDTYPNVKSTLEDGRTFTYIQSFADGDKSILIMPVRREQEISGVVVLANDPASQFTDNEQDIVYRIVARASIAIENANLYEAVQEADKAKSEFVGIVAHDLKSPMTSIRGYSDLMIFKGDITEEQSEYLHRVKDTVQRMEILVSDLADISRIESGHFFMEESIVPVISIVQAVKDGTMPQMETHGHTYVENVESDLPDMQVDYYRLLQVLTNLVSNAYKYTPEGGTITLTAKRVDKRIQFSVTDTGIGLSKEAIAKLGTKFWRAEDKFTRSKPGTGLGFSITKNLIEQMGSHVKIESELNKGSTFTFDVAIVTDTANV